MRTAAYSFTLAGRPTTSSHNATGPRGTTRTMTYLVDSIDAQIAVVGVAYPFEVVPTTLCRLLVQSEAKQFTATLSREASGTAGGHAFRQAVLMGGAGMTSYLRVWRCAGAP